jgi:hypothetical protein
VSDEWTAVAPENVLPLQFHARPSAVLQPEKRLMLAVLEHAVWQLLYRPSDAQIVEAEAWVASEAVDWPFTFLNVCQALGLDAGYIRGGLRRAACGRAAAPAASPPRHFAFRRLVATRQRLGGPVSALGGRIARRASVERPSNAGRRTGLEEP